MGVYTRVSGIYCITNIQNNKKYIGYSKNIRKRWDTHKCRLRRNLSHCTHLQSAWNYYGEGFFVFSILEVLSDKLTKQEYESIETTWVLKFQTHLSEYGYNGVLPGTIPSKEEGSYERTNNRIPLEFICINMNTKEVSNAIGIQEVVTITGIVSRNKIIDLTSHWEGKCKRKSLYGWIIIRKERYNPEFDYIGYKKKRRCKNEVKKTWKDYYNKTKYRKAPEDIIPYKDRNLKRVSVVAVNVITKEEKIYTMLKDCYKEFMLAKVYKCLNAPFGKYQHRGYYFRRIEKEN